MLRAKDSTGTGGGASRYHRRMFSIDGAWPRFRGRTQRILAVYETLRDDPAIGLHPRQIGLRVGMSALAAKRLLDAVPELFVKLPKRDGLTRYRLNSFATAASPDAVRALVLRGARWETLAIYGMVGAVLLAVLAAVFSLQGTQGV